MKTAQDYIKNSTGYCMGGFNSRLFGESFTETTRSARGYVFNELSAGWYLADGMIKDGKIYSKIRINQKELEFRCFKDGNQYCCVGKGFENLQESKNYAFGDSFDEAIVNFALLEHTK